MGQQETWISAPSSSSIPVLYTATGDANDAQRRYNQIAEEARAQAALQLPATGTGPN